MAGALFEDLEFAQVRNGLEHAAGRDFYCLSISPQPHAASVLLHPDAGPLPHVAIIRSTRHAATAHEPLGGLSNERLRD